MGVLSFLSERLVFSPKYLAEDTCLQGWGIIHLISNCSFEFILDATEMHLLPCIKNACLGCETMQPNYCSYLETMDDNVPHVESGLDGCGRGGRGGGGSESNVCRVTTSTYVVSHH